MILGANVPVCSGNGLDRSGIGAPDRGAVRVVQEGGATGCYGSIVVAAPVETGGAGLRNFHDLSWAKGVINSVEPMGGKKGTEPGARRVLNGVLNETLLALDDNPRTVRSSIDDDPDALARGNVRGFTGQARAYSVTVRDTTFVGWASSRENSNGGVKESCDPVYRALLGALQNHFA